MRISSTCLSILCSTVRFSSLVLFWSNCGKGLPVCCCCAAILLPSLKTQAPISLQLPSAYKNQKKKKPHTHTHNLTHSHNKTIPYFPFFSFPFPFQQREQTEPLGSAPTTPKPVQIAMQKTTLSYNLLFHTKESWRRRRRTRGTHCFERVQGHKMRKWNGWMYLWMNECMIFMNDR